MFKQKGTAMDNLTVYTTAILTVFYNKLLIFWIKNQVIQVYNNRSQYCLTVKPAKHTTFQNF